MGAAFLLFLNSLLLAVSGAEALQPEERASCDPTRFEFGPYSEYVILGAGPGGLQLGAFLQHKNRDYRIIDRGNDVGETFRHYPRHDTLISLNKRYTRRDHVDFNLRHDWNSLLDPVSGGVGDLPFSDFSQDLFPNRTDYVRYLEAYASKHCVRTDLGRDIVTISRNEESGLFSLVDQNELVTTCKYLIVATALSQPNIPDGIDGIELAEGYETISGDASNYTNQSVLVLGLGNSAFETAVRSQETAGWVAMVGRSSGGLQQAYVTHYVGDIRAINNNVFDTFFLQSLDTIDVNSDLRGCQLKEVEGDDNDKQRIRFTCDGITQPHYREPFDRVIRCLGWKFDTSIFHESAKPDLMPKPINPDYITYEGRGPAYAANKFPHLDINYRSVNIPNLYFAGMLMHARDYKKSAGGFIHGYRYLIRSLHRIMEGEHHKVPWPMETLGVATYLTKPEHTISNATVIAQTLLQSAQTSSALYQMFGVLADAVFISNNVVRYIREFPLDYFLNAAAQTANDMIFTIQFDYGHAGPNGFANNGFVAFEPKEAHLSQFLHPIVSVYKPISGQGDRFQLVTVHHILEDLLTTWDDDVLYTEPLVEFVVRTLMGNYKSQFEDDIRYSMENHVESDDDGEESGLEEEL